MKCSLGKEERIANIHPKFALVVDHIQVHRSTSLLLLGCGRHASYPWGGSSAARDSPCSVGSQNEVKSTEELALISQWVL